MWTNDGFVASAILPDGWFRLPIQLWQLAKNPTCRCRAAPPRSRAHTSAARGQTRQLFLCEQNFVTPGGTFFLHRWRANGGGYKSCGSSCVRACSNYLFSKEPRRAPVFFLSYHVIHDVIHVPYVSQAYVSPSFHGLFHSPTEPLPQLIAPCWHPLRLGQGPPASPFCGAPPTRRHIERRSEISHREQIGNISSAAGTPLVSKSRRDLNASGVVGLSWRLRLKNQNIREIQPTTTSPPRPSRVNRSKHLSLAPQQALSRRPFHTGNGLPRSARSEAGRHPVERTVEARGLVCSPLVAEQSSKHLSLASQRAPIPQGNGLPHSL